MRHCSHSPGKRFGRLMFLLILIALHSNIQGQNVPADVFFKKYADTIDHPFNVERPYYLIEWEGTLLLPVRIIRTIRERLAIIELNDQEQYESLKRQYRISPANDKWKYSPYIAKTIESDNNKQGQFILTFYDIKAIADFMKKRNGFSVLHVDLFSHSLLVKTNSQFLIEQLLPLRGIIFIDERAAPRSEASIIGYNRGFHGINAVDYTIPGANGKGIVAGVKEQKIDAADIDLFNRILPSSIASSNISSHATVISSIIGGSGNSFYDGRGIANGCKFFSSSFENLFVDNAAILNANRVTVQNHSYGTIVQQFYGAEAVSYDAQAWLNKNIVAVFSAGNRGTSAAAEGPYANLPGFANLTGNFKMAKNVLTVGAIDNKGNIPAETSSGPLYDGRIAPQLTALGPNGTSDAAAIVSGTIAVMQQVFSDSNIQVLPPASLIKALLYNSAEDIYHKGIDYKTGYGLVNSFASIKSLQQKEFDGSNIGNGGLWIKIIQVPVNAAQLKVTLAWTDTTAAINNYKALINDLDLEVVEFNTGNVYKPWVLSAVAHIDSLSKEPVRKRDSLNTAEQVSIALPAQGNYQIKVIGTSASSNPIPFHIAYHVDTLNTFHFTSPQHASDINRTESPETYIRWKTFVADTNQTGNLSISYNGGADWQILKPGIKIYSNEYLWTIKDTNSRAMLKMETGFGNFLSGEFIVAQSTRPNLDFLCTDSFRLSWNKHIYADSYKIFALIDSPYLKHILTVADTFINLKRSVYPSTIYAIEPVLNNSIPAARSVALNIDQQGVHCFYRTFYYNLLDLNRLELVLDLSAPDYVDSLVFEQVNQAGQWIRNIGTIKTTTNHIYRQLAEEVPAGTSYWRVKIKLKSGAIIYTEIISVLTSGKQFILFYPNPVNRNQVLNYMLQQGTGTDCRLQLFDISGRLLKDYPEMPGSIDVSSFPPGVILYKLYTSDGKFLERGRLVVW